MKPILKQIFMLSFIFFFVFSASGCDLLNGGGSQTEQYAITIAGSIGGTTSGTNLYNEGDIVNAVATPNEGYVFWHWVQSSQIVSTEATYSFTATDNISMVAFFLLEDQSHLEGVYYLQQSLYAGERLFNTSEAIRRYTLNSDNTYVIEDFDTQTGDWVNYESGNYINDNGVDVTFVSSQDSRKLFYDLNEATGEIEYHYVENDGLNNRTIYNNLIPWPQTPFRIEHEYNLIAGVENDASIVINAQEPEVFNMNADGTFTWSYYEEGVQQVRTGTYEVIGKSILLNEQDSVYTIYEITYETQANVEYARMSFQKRLENGLTYESRIFEFDYLS